MKLTTRALTAAATTAGLALLTALTPTAAQAADAPPPPDNSPAKLAEIVVAPTGPNVSTLTFSQAPTSTTVPRARPAATRINSGVLSGTGTKLITPPGGSRGGLYDAFTSTVAVTSTNTTLHGSSQGVWEGSRPLKATRIALVDNVSTTGIGVSFSAGPVGAEFGHSSDSWTYSTSLAAAYNLTHSYSGLQFGGAILTVSESSQVTANFSGSSFAQITN